MKDMKYYFRFLMLALCVSFAACSEEDAVVKPVFPGLQEIVCAVGDTKELTFEASTDWTLTSSSLWCSFVADGEETFSCSGTAGKQTVTIHISNDAAELLKSYKADLTLMMNGEKAIAFTITRPVTGYEVNVFNADQSILYTKENPIVKSYDKNQVLVITANTDWVVEPSEGVILKTADDLMYGAAGKTVTIRTSLNPGFIKEAWDQKITFKNRKNEVIAELPMKYDGIPADKIEFDNTNVYANTIIASPDGESYTFNKNTYDAEGVPLNVVAKDDKYTCVGVEFSVERDENWANVYTFKRLAGASNWLYVENDRKGNLKIATKANEAGERTAYLMVFPNAKYDEVKDDFENKVFTTAGIADEYAQYIGANIKQEQFLATSGFTLLDGMTSQPLRDGSGNIINAELNLDASEAEYGTTNVYMISSLTLGKNYGNIQVIPNGFPSSNIQISTVFKGTDTRWKDVEYEGGQFNGRMGFAIWGINEQTNGDAMIFTVKNGAEVFAVLVIEKRYED